MFEASIIITLATTIMLTNIADIIITIVATTTIDKVNFIESMDLTIIKLPMAVVTLKSILVTSLLEWLKSYFLAKLLAHLSHLLFD